jgi:hypothetical protein
MDLYKELMRGGFDAVEKEEKGFRVETHHNSMWVKAYVGSEGRIVKIESTPTLLTWVLGILLLPVGTLFVLAYYMIRLNDRQNKLKMRISAITI